MVQFLDMSNDKNKRKVREVVFIGGETIRVYEPTKEDIELIIDIQENALDGIKEKKNAVEEKDKTSISMSGEDIVRTMFPLLTDIKGMEELTDEEVAYVIDNPSLAFLQVNHVIEGIVTEVWKMVILEAKNRVLETDFKIEVTRATNEMNQRTMNLGERENSKKMEKLKEAQDKVAKARETEAEKVLKAMIEEDKKSETPKEPIEVQDKAQVALDKYKDIFK